MSAILTRAEVARAMAAAKAMGELSVPELRLALHHLGEAELQNIGLERTQAARRLGRDPDQQVRSIRQARTHLARASVCLRDVARERHEDQERERRRRAWAR